MRSAKRIEADDRERPDLGGAWRGALAAGRSWRNGLARSSVSPSPSRSSAGNCAPWAIASGRRAGAIVRGRRGVVELGKELRRRAGMAARARRAIDERQRALVLSEARIGQKNKIRVGLPCGSDAWRAESRAPHPQSAKLRSGVL